MRVYEAKSVDEALSLAEEFKRTGKYRWFRGQSRQWPLRSTFQRRCEVDQHTAAVWLTRFRNWLFNIGGLWPVAADSDQAMAVAQHYGIPTDLLDFTTDPCVAGYFATETANVSAGSEGACCILCLDLENLQAFWKVNYHGYRSPEPIEVMVPNLWRLEAQKGVFLFCPYADFEKIYPTDRILFPASRSSRIPPVDRVYPPQESALEILLRQFIMTKAIRDFNDEMQCAARPIHHDSPAEGYESEVFIKNEIDVLSSWSERELRAWYGVVPEAYDSTVGGESLDITVPWEDDLQQTAAKVAQTISIALEERSGLRRRSIRPHVRVRGIEVPADKLQAFETALGRLWDGLRILPYTSQEIAAGCGNCVAIMVAHWAFEQAGGWNPGLNRAIELALGADFEVEFGLQDGSYSRAFVRENDLRQIMRPDLYGLVRPEYRDTYKRSLEDLLLDIHSPRRLFDFRGLAHLFAVTLAPIQVLTRRPPDAIVYSPARLDTFGLP